MAKLRLERIKGNTYYIPGYVNIGVYRTGPEVVLIDSGIDQNYGKRVIKALDEHDLRVKLIISSHSHPDHIGGNAFIQKLTGCRIAAAEPEAAFINRPLLMAAFFYGGFPPRNLHNKRLMAEPSVVTDYITAEGEILDTGLEAFSLPGHSVELIGVMTPDQVFFPGDALMEKRTIKKYHLLYIYSIRQQLETLERLSKIRAELYKPSHGDGHENLDELVRVNREEIQKACSIIRTCCQEALLTEEVLQRICGFYQLKPDPMEYALLLSTVRSYLSHLYDQGELECRLNDGAMVWQSKSVEI